MVGINTFIVSRSGGFQGVGFAVPINIALVILSTVLLNNYTREHPELFGV